MAGDEGNGEARTGLRAYIPISEDSALSTRGQNLPGLLKSLSSSTPRRNSSFRFIGDLVRSVKDDSPLKTNKSARSLHRHTGSDTSDDEDEDLSFGKRPQLASEDRRMSHAEVTLMTPQMRSQRLIGNSNPRYKWERYFKTDAELKKMKKPIREYYERNNHLIMQYLYIDKLLDSSLPHDLIQEYNRLNVSSTTSKIDIPGTITEESPITSGPITPSDSMERMKQYSMSNGNSSPTEPKKVKRTPKTLYKLPEADENTPLIQKKSPDDEEAQTLMPEWVPEEDTDGNAPIVKKAIWVNFAANSVLLVLKIIVTVLTSSVSVLASLVDGALDFLSTLIVFITTRLINKQDKYLYPVGRRRLEPLGVLIFSVIMITSFFQVALEGFSKLTGSDHTVIALTYAAIGIMAATVVVKFFCWLWCRLINNSSVQALAQDAMTDVVFNTFSIIFPLVGYFANVWWLDPLGGIVLAIYVVANWSTTVKQHVRNLTGAAADADDRNVLLYLTMRFAKTIKHIQGLEAYHAGDKLNVEVDIVLDENTTLRDSHDLGESLQYVLESVPTVDRAFVHLDYASWNLPSHMQQQE